MHFLLECKVPSRYSAESFEILRQGALNQRPPATLDLTGPFQITPTHSVPARGSNEYFAAIHQAAQAHAKSNPVPLSPGLGNNN